jgi:hypothetical protein
VAPTRTDEDLCEGFSPSHPDLGVRLRAMVSYLRELDAWSCWNSIKTDFVSGQGERGGNLYLHY